MSGIDEQFKYLVPTCPRCGENPHGYTLGRGTNPFVWLSVRNHNDPNAYLEYDGYVSYENLQQCNYIFCYACNEFIEEKNFPKQVMEVRNIIWNLIKKERRNNE